MTDHASAVEDLRCQAEARLSARLLTPANPPMLTPAESQRLIHELQVHQIELELQNQALMEMRDRLKQSLEKYTDFFDVAPMGYLVLDDHGAILEANPAAATLLRVNRCDLIARRLGLFISLETRPTFNAFVDMLMAGTAKKSCEVTLDSETAAPRYLHLEGVGVAARTGWQCRIAATDITQHPQLEKLQTLSRRLVAIQEAERRTLAYTFHEDFGQELAAIKLELSRLDHAGVSACVGRVDRIIGQIREMASKLRPSILDDLGLSAALNAYAHRQTRRTGCTIDLQGYLPPLPPEMEIAVFRIVQTAIYHAIHDGAAQQITVNTGVDQDRLRLLIEDNGRGFDPVAVPAELEPSRLMSIRERTELLGGQWLRTSQLGVGTRIEIALPLVGVTT
ncbi:MAG: ATP-binding protein [Candidatus Competibacteraceae bacterium]